MAYEGTNYRAPCTCCPECNNTPCDGAAAGGTCDHLCDCDEDDHEEFENECYMGADGYCSAAGSEHCDWDCPNGGC